MKVFFDTTVLVAASERAHPHFPQAKSVLLRVARAEERGFVGAHSIAEVFAALTRLPVQPRVHPAEAMRIVVDNILPHFEIVSLGVDDYVATLGQTASGGWIGAKIYDALLVRCAAKCEAERVYTLNVTDFRRLASPALQSKICSP